MINDLRTLLASELRWAKAKIEAGVSRGITLARLTTIYARAKSDLAERGLPRSLLFETGVIGAPIGIRAIERALAYLERSS